MPDTEPDRAKTLRKVLRALNGTVNVLTSLDRDPPIVEIAILQMNGAFSKNGLLDMETELFPLLSQVNRYRSRYWSLERSIMQSFLRYLRSHGYLPSSSPEVESLKMALPGELIKADGRIWIYSYDHYIAAISGMVGRKKEGAPVGSKVFKDLSEKYASEIGSLLGLANGLLSDIIIMRARTKAALRNPERRWKDLKIRKPKVHSIQRPVKRALLIKRPIPLPKKGKGPRRKVLKRSQVQIIGPEGGA